MDGIILINKPLNCTSHDVVNKVRKICHTKKVGHCGTLDPLASGVLVLCINKATKALQFITSEDKEYIATITLGKATDTYDLEGKITSEKEYQNDLTLKQVEETLKTFLGKQKQVPPIYSAIKVNGKKLYEYARSGKKVEIEPREIEIFDIDLISISKDMKEIVYKVWCSKGTYIRSLCEDIAERLGTVGFMSGLNRTRVGDFRIEQAVKISDVAGDDGVVNRDIIKSKFISIEEFFKDYKSLNFNDLKIFKFLNGVMINVNLEDGIYKIYNKDIFIGIGIVKNNRIKRDIIIV